METSNDDRAAAHLSTDHWGRGDGWPELWALCLAHEIEVGRRLSWVPMLHADRREAITDILEDAWDRCAVAGRYAAEDVAVAVDQAVHAWKARHERVRRHEVVLDEGHPDRVSWEGHSAPNECAGDRFQVSKEDLDRALAKLDDRDRVILKRTVQEGAPTGEVAMELGMTEGAVRVRKFRALKKLKDALPPPPANLAEDTDL